MGWTPLPTASRCARLAVLLTPSEEGGVHGTGSHDRDRSGEEQLSAARCAGGWVGCVPQEAEPGEAVGLCGCAATLHGGDGGVRRRAPLGPGDRQSRPCGATGPTDLRQSVRQAAEERCVGRGGDLRGVVAPDHALCGCEDGGTAGSGHAVPDARSSGAPAHPDDQYAARPSGGVRCRCPAGAGSCRPAGLGA